MPSRFVYSVQSFLKWKGNNPGPLDGDIGPLTTAAWNLFLDAEEARIATVAIGTAEKAKSSGAAIGFEANGSNAKIRGRFSLSESQMEHICSVHPFSAYARYGPAIIANANQFGINPLFVLADLVNQGVNPAYNNPWGISTDHYPHGPNGSELGEPNGRVKNGPRKFSDAEWRIAFDRQFAVVESGKAYSSANTIGEWAKIDAPAGAENDVHGTNSDEGAEVGHLYNVLVSRLT
jgi:hypothetical protein